MWKCQNGFQNLTLLWLSDTLYNMFAKLIKSVLFFPHCGFFRRRIPTKVYAITVRPSIKSRPKATKPKLAINQPVSCLRGSASLSLMKTTRDHNAPLFWRKKNVKILHFFRRKQNLFFGLLHTVDLREKGTPIWYESLLCWNARSESCTWLL